MLPALKRVAALLQVYSYGTTLRAGAGLLLGSCTRVVFCALRGGMDINGDSHTLAPGEGATDLAAVPAA